MSIEEFDPFGPQYTTAIAAAVMPQVKELLYIPGTVVAGGAARWAVLLEDEKIDRGLYPSDIDVFLLAGTDVSAVRQRLASFRYRLVGESHGTSKWERDYGDLPVQLIDRSNIKGSDVGAWVTPKDVIKTFGFTTEMFALWCEYPNRHIRALYTVEGAEDTEAHILRVNYIIDPVRLAYRMNKYGRKGYTVEPSEVLTAFDRWLMMTDEQRDAIRKDIGNEAYRLAMGEPRA